MINTSSNKTSVPEAKSAMNKFNNGNLTSAQNGSVGGYMVKKMIEAQEREMASRG